MLHNLQQLLMLLLWLERSTVRICAFKAFTGLGKVLCSLLIFDRPHSWHSVSSWVLPVTCSSKTKYLKITRVACLECFPNNNVHIFLSWRLLSNSLEGKVEGGYLSVLNKCSSEVYHERVACSIRAGIFVNLL